MHIHILGICGTFMGGLAALARESGHAVTGCDANVYPPMSEQLGALGIELTDGFDAGQLGLRPDLFVIGNVVTRGNPLMEAILDAGVPYTSGPQWLAENVLQGRHVLAVAGTHGKTSTTSMLAWVLDQAGLAPGFLVGGVPLNFAVSARLGRIAPLAPFVIEADEYDTAFFDKRAKFVHYRPRTAVLNNLEFDHADIFDDLAAIERQFHHLVRTVPANGRLVVNARDDALRRVLTMGCWSEVQRFGARKEEPGALRARGEPHAFDVLRGALKVARVEWSMLGEHNQLNALAAIAAAEHVGIAPEASAEALASFRNVRRRLELRGEAGGVKVYDDFAHHPTAIRTTINGLRRKVGLTARILAVFEPRSNTMKQGAMKAQLPWALEEADLSFCHSGGLDWDASQALAPMGTSAVVCGNIGDLVKRVVASARPGDHVLCMSNGGFGGMPDKLLQALPADDGRRPDCYLSSMLPTPTHLLYLHGFRSSPQSTKACRMASWVQEHRPDLVWHCPQLPASPRAAMDAVAATVSQWPEDRMAVIGSSLGGFYATLVAERTGCRAVLLNPAVDPARDLASHIGETTAWHSDERFYFREEFIDELRNMASAESVLRHPERLFAVIAKGDEVLDWREMAARYASCRLRLLERGDHALGDFDDHLDAVVDFLGLAVSGSSATASRTPAPTPPG